MEREFEYLPAGAAQSRTEIPWSAAAPSPALGAPEAFLLLSAEVKMQMWGWVGTNLLLFLWVCGLLATGTPSSHHTELILGTGVALLRKCG